MSSTLRAVAAVRLLRGVQLLGSCALPVLLVALSGCTGDVCGGRKCGPGPSVPAVVFHVSVDGRAVKDGGGGHVSIPRGHRARFSIDMIVPGAAEVDQLYVVVATESWGLSGGKPSGAHETLVYQPERSAGFRHYAATWTATPVGKSASMYLVAIYEEKDHDIDVGTGQPLAVIELR
jgi:hypothetical protein